MNSYFAGFPVVQTVNFVDLSGTPVTPTSATYQVLDADSNVVVADTPLVVTGSSVEITVQATDNALDTGEMRDLRQIKVAYVVAGNTMQVTVPYVIETQDALEVMQNSFATYPRVLLASQMVGDIDAFNAADRTSQIAALATAFQSLTQMRYVVAGVTYPDIGALTKVEFDALPDRFRNLIIQAQIVEAADLLDPSSVSKRRQLGLLSETIGESSMFFRPEKVLPMPITRRSLNLLRGYITWEMGIGRA